MPVVNPQNASDGCLSAVDGQQNLEHLLKTRGLLRDTLSSLIHHRSAKIGGLLVGLVILLAVFAPLIALEGPLVGNVVDRNQAPSLQHLLGTDPLGRDVLSRLAWGSRVTLAAAMTAAALAVLLGSVAGLSIGFRGGWLDILTMRLMEIVMSVPALLLALAIMAMRGQGLWNGVMALVLVGIPYYARIARSAVLATKNQDYVLASRACGAGDARILWRHIVPNTFGPILTYSALGVASSITDIAAMGFLGLGVRPPAPEVGAMLSYGATWMFGAPWIMISAGVTILLAVLGLNFFSDALRDALDPSLRCR